MTFSIVIPTYNRKHLLEKCLASLFAQTFPKNDYEVIVVDDSSSDSTVNSLKTLNPPIPFRFFSQEHKGPAAARNLGIKQAQGKIIAFTDDDCVPPKDWLEKLYDGFKRHPEVAGVGGYQEAEDCVLQKNLIAKYERFQTREIYKAKEEEVLGGFETPGIVTNNVAFKKSILKEIGGFDENFPVAAGEDADLKKRVTDKDYALLYIPLKVEHRQEYSLKRFLYQQYVRGIGAKFFRKKWGHSEVDWLSPLKIILQFLRTLLKSRSVATAALELFGRIWMFAGELKEVR